jgi:hypothetical protein
VGAGVNQAAGRQLAIAGLDNRLTDGGKVNDLLSINIIFLFLVLISVRG